MATILTKQTSMVQAYPMRLFPENHNLRSIQFIPQPGVGFTGSVVIEESFAASPSINDFTPIMTVTFTGHASNLTVEVESSALYMRVRIASSQQGSVAIYGDSSIRSLQGAQSTAAPHTAVIDSPRKAAGTGSNFKINSIVVPSFTTDDVVYSGDFSKTLTDILDGTNNAVGKQNKIGTGLITADEGDLNVLTGAADYGLVAADMQKLADVTVSALEINRLSGVTANVQTQINALEAEIDASLGVVADLTGLTATADDLNVFTGIATGTGGYSAQISAAEIGHLDGVTSNIQIQLNGKRSTATPIGIAEISGATITVAELNRLSGASSNIQAQINALTTGSITPAGGTFTGVVEIANGSAAAPSVAFDSAVTTGIYKFGATGFGLAVGGARFATVDGVDMVVGGGATNGAPTLKGVGMGASNPAYSFTGDTNTGLYWAGADAVGVVAGGETMASFDATNNVISIGGPAASNNAVAVTGVFAGERVLGRANVMAGTTTGVAGQTTLYTVPAGRSAIITKILVRLTKVVSLTDDSVFRMNIGWGADFDELVDNTTNTTIFNPAGYSFTTAGQVMPLGVGSNSFPAISGSAGADYGVMTAASVLRADVKVRAAANEFDFEVIVFGHEF